MPANSSNLRSFGQLNVFALRCEQKHSLAIERFPKEAQRLLGVLEKRLAASPYIAGDDYSIADIASYPWVHEARDKIGIVLDDTFAASPATLDWLARVGARPAVVKGMKVLET